MLSHRYIIQGPHAFPLIYSFKAQVHNTIPMRVGSFGRKSTTSMLISSFTNAHYPYTNAHILIRAQVHNTTPMRVCSFGRKSTTPMLISSFTNAHILIRAQVHNTSARILIRAQVHNTTPMCMPTPALWQQPRQQAPAKTCFR